MAVRLSLVVRGCLLGLMGFVCSMTCLVARAQGSCTFTDENGKTVTWPNCEDPNEKTGPAKPAPATTPAGITKTFPFPGETPATPASPAGSSAQTPSGSATQPGDSSAPGTAKRFPFPGDDSAGSATKPEPGLQDAGSSGSSSDSSSSSSSSSSDSRAGEGPLADDDDPAAAAAAARKARRHLPKVDTQTPDQREKEDLDVAEFYQENANYRGAYERASDAVSITADDPNAHFALAEAARRLGKLDEAEANYKKCLTLDPVPKIRKAAEKALKEMAGG